MPQTQRIIKFFEAAKARPHEVRIKGESRTVTLAAAWQMLEDVRAEARKTHSQLPVEYHLFKKCLAVLITIQKIKDAGMSKKNNA